MRPYLLCAAALSAAALAAAPPRADDKARQDDTKYAIKPTEFVAKGRSARFDMKATFSSATRKTDGDGAVLEEQKENKSSLSLYVEKTLEVDDKGKRTKFSRAYRKARTASGGRAEDKPYHDRTVLFANVKGKWKVSAVGKPQLDAGEL
jgi:hypothetical protein